MKLKKLTIKNITSITSAEIDFDQAPLSDSGLFLITGPTGSGKTSILDAICLALYGDTPRLAFFEGDRQGRQQTEGSDNGLSIKPAKQLLRRGSDAGEVQLTFEGNDGKDYEAICSLHRTHNKTKGEQWNIKRRLTKIKGEETWTKKRDITDKIHELIGLDFAQFCRTSMLAQGQFTKFLHAKTNERSDILEKITRTNIYSDIGRIIFSSFQAAETAYKAQQSMLQAQQSMLLSEEDLNVLRQELEDTQHKLERLDAEQQGLNTYLDWLNKAHELQQSVLSRQSELQRSQEELEGPEHRTQASLVADWESAQSVIPIFVELPQRLEGVEAQKRAQNEAQRRYRQLLGYLELKQQALSQVTAKQKRLQGERNTLILRQPMYEQINFIREMLQQEQRQRLVAMQQVQLQRQSEQSLAELEPKLNLAKDELQEYQAKLLKLETKLTEHQSSYSADEHELLRTRQGDIRQAIQLQQSLSTSQEAYRTALRSRDTASEALREREQELPQLSEARNKAEQEHHTAKKILEVAALSLDDLAKGLRSQLQAGDRCPVCDQTIIALLQDEELEQRLAPLRQQEAQAKEQLGEAQEKENKAKAELIAQKNYLVDRERALAQALSALESAEQKHQTAFDALGLGAEDNLEVILEQTTEAVEQQAQLQRQLNELQGQLVELQKEYGDQQAKIAKLENEQSRLSQLIASQGENAQRAEEQANACLQTASLHIHTSMGDWQSDWTASPDEWMQRLEKEAQHYQALGKTLEQGQQELNNLSESLRNLQALVEQVWQLESTWQELSPLDGSGLQDNVFQSLPSDLASRTTALRAAQERLAEVQKSLETFAQEHPQITHERLKELARCTEADIQAQRQAIRDRETAWQAAEALYNDQQEQLRTHERTRPEGLVCEEAESYRSLREDLMAQSESLRTRRGEISGQIEANQRLQTSQADEQRKLEALQRESDEWDQLNRLLGQKDGARFRTIAQSCILGELIRGANKYLRSFLPGYELVLESTYSLNFEVRNCESHEQIGIPNLSGGQSFIISLALALALAGLRNNVMGPDILFIDEGFGSLSSEVLGQVMATLEKLQSETNRRVGIISHVDMMREAITTQIRVRPHDTTRSEITVCSS